MPRDILVDMIVGSIVFGVIYDITKNMFHKPKNETNIETVEAIVVQEDSDDDNTPFTSGRQRIIIEIAEDDEDDASTMTLDAEITDANKDKELP